MYLASKSRPDIAFAVHQCTWFTHCTRKSHEQAVIWICRYLKGTVNDGLIKPTKDLRVDLFVMQTLLAYGEQKISKILSVSSLELGM